MRNWKTTVGGLISSVGVTLSTLPGKLGLIGQILSAAGLLLLGNSAADAGKA